MDKMKPKCEDCRDTGWYGDLGPGIRGNREYQRCECMAPTKMKICPTCNGAGVISDNSVS
jgi:DnaJ-class molecular chaperone